MKDIKSITTQSLSLNNPSNIYMNTEKIKHSLKKLRDFILCCRKTLDEADDVFDVVEEMIY